MPLFDLSAFDTTTINQEWIDVKLITARRALPLHKRGNRLFVALSDPTNLQALEEFRFQDRLIARAHRCRRRQTRSCDRRLLLSATTKSPFRFNVDVGDDIDLDIKVEDGPAAEEDTGDVDDAPVVRYIQKILIDAINSAFPTSISNRTKSSIASATASMACWSKSRSRHWSSGQDRLLRIKVISKLDISEKRVPQDGRMKLRSTEPLDRFPRQHTADALRRKIVMRILDSSNAMLGIDALGYDADQRAALMAAISSLRHDPGHRTDRLGKTISLYTCLGFAEQTGHQHLDSRKIRRKSICQASIRLTSMTKAGLTFAAALKSFLRQDPGHHHGRRNSRPGNR